MTIEKMSENGQTTNAQARTLSLTEPPHTHTSSSSTLPYHTLLLICTLSLTETPTHTSSSSTSSYHTLLLTCTLSLTEPPHTHILFLHLILPYVTLCGESEVHERLQRHPLSREGAGFRALVFVHVRIQVPVWCGVGRPKKWRTQF